MAGHSPSKTGVNALMPGHPRLAFVDAKTWMPGTRPGMTEEKLGRLGFLVLIIASAAPAHAASRREAAQIVEHAGPALAARERAVECRERAREAFVLVIDPGAQHRGEQHCQALRADHAARAGRVDVGG